MKAKRKKPILILHEDKAYLKPEHAGIHALCLMCDGIPITMFTKKGPLYMNLDDAIEYHRKEIEFTNLDHNKKFLNLLTRAKERFETGNLEFV